MRNRVRQILFSAPVVTIAILFALYSAAGFLLAPALVKWQIEKQVPAQLGHRVSLGDARFNPFALRLELDEFDLADAEGRSLLAFRRLLADLELRSVLDRGWTFAEFAMDAPVVRLVVGRDGRLNYAALLDRLTASEPAEESAAVPRIAIERVALTDGRLEFYDSLLDEPMVARIEPLRIEIDRLSTAPDHRARFRISARTAAGETLATSGELGLAPVAVKGTLALEGLEVATLARGLSRLVAIDSPAGTVRLAANFDVGVAADGALSGGVQHVDLGVIGLSMAAAGAKAPLLVADTLAFEHGRIDFDQREAAFGKVVLAKGGIAAAMDAQGGTDWAKLVQMTAPQPAASAHADPALREEQSPATRQKEPLPAATASTASAAGPAASQAPRSGQSSAGSNGPDGPAPNAWRVTLASAEIADIAVAFADEARGRSARIATAGFEAAVSAQVGPAWLSIDLDQPALSLIGARVVDGADSLGLPRAKISAGRVAIAAADRGFAFALEAPNVAASEGMSAQQGDAQFDLGSVLMQGARAGVNVNQAVVSGSIGAPQFKFAGIALSHPEAAASLSDVSFESKRIGVDVGAGRLDASFEQPRTGLAGIKLAREGEDLVLRSVALNGETLTLSRAAANWRVAAGGSMLSLSGLAANRSGERAAFDELKAEGGSVTLSLADTGDLDFALQNMQIVGSVLVLDRVDDGFELRSATVGGDAITLTQGESGLRVTGSGVRLAASGVSARQATDRIAMEDASFAARRISMANDGNDTPGVEARVDGAELRLASLGIVAQGAPGEVLRVADGTIGATSLVLAVPEGPLALTGDGLTATLAELVLGSPVDASEMVRMGSATLTDGTFDLAKRSVAAEQLTVTDGAARTWLDDEGKFNGLILIRGAVAATSGGPEETAPVAPDEEPPGALEEEPPAPAWRLALASAELDRMAVTFEDRRAVPPLAIGLDAISGRVTGLDTASPAPMRLDVQATVASGGSLRVSGDVRATDGKSDLEIALSGIALAPAQRYLSEVAALELASGTVSSNGRLRYGDESGAGARLVYEGGIAVDRLALNEIGSERAFLTWGAVASDDVVLTLEPDRVDIGELRVERPSGRLIIAEDQTVNLADVLKEPEAPVEAPGRAQPAEPAGDPFPVAIARIRVTEGTLEFADLSLLPQFSARMHELKGVVSGLGTAPGSLAELQLDARVDKYGSARIRGQISVPQPTRRTEIDMRFRNLSMNALSPYVVKFAGYRIAAGRLALDLKYEVKDDKLLGSNQIVLNEVKLGEKVESPGALDLPLELAIAVLKDADGVIELGLPVSGDLTDPQFDYGAIIGKAIGSALGKVVTAPFGVLAAMIGSGDKQNLDTITFEAGSDEIAPAEREKLDIVARAMKDRPALRLVVPPTYEAGEDMPVLKSRMVRTDIARRVGGEVREGEDPGPVDTENPRVQRAIESTYIERYGPEALTALKRSAAEAAAPAAKPAGRAGNPAPPAAGAKNDAKPPSAKLPPLPPEVYQGLVDQLIEEQPVTKTMLAELADRRGEAIVRELTTHGGVPAERVVLGGLRKAEGASGDSVALRLQLEAAKQE